MEKDTKQIALDALNRIEFPNVRHERLKYLIKNGIFRIGTKYAISYRGGYLVHKDINYLKELN